MNLFKLSWKYLVSKPLSTLLSIVLVALGIGLASFIFLVNHQFEERLYKNIENIDLVVGAKGSPLQMILSSVYHVDVPTGNIPLEDCKIGVLKNPYIQKAIPLALGDNFDGYRIVGTDHQFVDHYDAKIAKGNLFEQDLEVTLGARVAQKMGLNIGDTFYGSHGLVQDGGHVHETLPYEVVGVFEASNLILDQLILTNVSSVWRMHADHDHEGHADHDHEGHADHDHEGHADHDHEGHADHDHEGHADHDHEAHADHDHQKTKTTLPPLSDKGKEITAYLVQYKKDKDGNTSMRATVEATLIIDQYSQSAGYAKPAIQLQRLMEMTGVGMSLLQNLAILILFISAFSMFISLYNSLKERKYEVALMRVMGATKIKLFSIIVIEGVLVALSGYILGTFLSHLSMELISANLEETYKYSFTGLLYLTEELYLLAAALMIGFWAALIPAYEAYKVDISQTLTQ
jgi:putative ABC transport system permease protein